MLQNLYVGMFRSTCTSDIGRLRLVYFGGAFSEEEEVQTHCYQILRRRPAKLNVYANHCEQCPSSISLPEKE